MVNVFDESINHDLPCYAGVGVEGEEETGVVIEPVNDFNFGSTCETPEGEI